jgi:hypothetical protein
MVAKTSGPNRKVGVLAAVLLLQLVMLTPALAGPPFETDDPFSLPLRTGEFYFFAAGTRSADGTALDAAPGIETNFSFVRNTFIHTIIPLSLNHPSGEKSAYGPGDIELGLKWQFLEQTDHRPTAGIFPILILPTGNADRGLGSVDAQLFLPLWLGFESGPWTTYGGGGHWINPGDGNLDWWFTGLLVQRQVTDRLFIGTEVYHQTPNAVGASAGTGVGLGGGITLSDPYQLLFSIGRDVQAPSQNQFSFYLALYRTF